VGFHFHPLVYYEGWEEEYPELGRRLLDLFRPEEVLFVSLGSVTFIKPVIREIRRRGGPTRILQIEMVPDPHGRLTYPDPIKVKLFRTMYAALAPWHDSVFTYLCMERSYFWREVFGRCYETNDEFEVDFGRHSFRKIRRRREGQSP
jgi:spore photoproduct lyase